MWRVEAAVALVLAEDTGGVPAAVEDFRALEDPAELGKAALVMEVRLELENRLGELDEPNAELEEPIMLIELNIELEIGMTELELDELKTELNIEPEVARTELEVERLIVEADSRIGTEEDDIELVEVAEGFDDDVLAKELKVCA